MRQQIFSDLMCVSQADNSVNAILVYNSFIIYFTFELDSRLYSIYYHFIVIGFSGDIFVIKNRHIKSWIIWCGGRLSAIQYIYATF